MMNMCALLTEMRLQIGIRAATTTDLLISLIASVIKNVARTNGDIVLIINGRTTEFG